MVFWRVEWLWSVACKRRLAICATVLVTTLTYSGWLVATPSVYLSKVTVKVEDLCGKCGLLHDSSEDCVTALTGVSVFFGMNTNSVLLR